MPLKSTPISLVPRRHARSLGLASAAAAPIAPSANAAKIADFIRENGASFFEELIEGTHLLRAQVEEALAELVALGLVSSDSFRGLRALLAPPKRASPAVGSRSSAARLWPRRRRQMGAGVDEAADAEASDAERSRVRGAYRAYSASSVMASCFCACWSARPLGCPGGVNSYAFTASSKREERFAAGGSLLAFPGEQFALPEAVGRLREVRRQEDEGDVDLAFWCRSPEPCRHSHAGTKASGSHRQPGPLPRRHSSSFAARRRSAIS